MIDVIMPVRNAPVSLWLALTSFWAFGFSKEIASVVVLDNCSTDPEIRPILAHVQNLARHQVIVHERNIGVWASVNRGLALSRSESVLVLTSDVLLGPGVVPALQRIFQEKRQAFVGPDVVTGLAALPHLAKIPTVLPLHPGYNGACVLMDWPRLREEVGWFDPRFYVCFGDTDYVERLIVKASEQQDTTLLPARVADLPICHLDKQSRRDSFTSAEDTEVEMRDGERFREKWKDHPEVLARHPAVSREAYIQFKESDLGGWKHGQVVASG